MVEKRVERRIAYQNYEELPPDFYDNSIDKANPFTKYYHYNRYEKIRKFILSRFENGMRILDIGSGSAKWNNCKFPVTGVDINKSMLEYAKRKGRIENSVLWDIQKKQIPLNSESQDIIILSDVLEHLEEPERILKEAHRLLKKEGFLMITVPLDDGICPWRILFEIGCIIRGNILGQDYFRRRCGHVQHFSVDDLLKILKKNGFEIEERDITILNIGMVTKKV